MTSLIRAHIAALPDEAPFIGPEALERARGRPFAARIGANESGFGPSPRAMTAMTQATADIWKYADPEVYELRAAIAERLGLGMDELVVGEGIDGLLGHATRLMLNPGDKVVTPKGGYPTFAYHVAAAGGVLETVDYENNQPNLEAMARRAQEVGAKILYIANPDNPLGGYWPAPDIARALELTPPGCLFLLDEAYFETAPENMAPPMHPVRENLLRMRTFSKAMGLAGLRVGYAIGPADIIGGFNKIRDHFGVGRVAQAGALAAWRDTPWLNLAVRKIELSRDWIAKIAQENGLIPLPSATNFVSVDCAQDGDFAARVLQELAARDIFVRTPRADGLNRCIRISCGPDQDMELLERELPAALEAARDQK